MTQSKTLFLTRRGLRHQQAALDSAPPELNITMRREITREEILALLPDMEFLITERSGEIDAEMIAAGKRLRLIQRLGGQTWDIDLGAARGAGIPVCAMPVESVILVAEHMLMQMLVLAKHLPETMAVANAAADWGKPPRRCDEDYFAYNWSERRGIHGLFGTLVGILGFGEIGFELARRLRPLDCTVMYNKRQRLPEWVEAEFGLHYATQEEIANRADFICSLLPYFPQTANSLDTVFFQSLKPGAYFVHCGAGAVVDEEALIVALRAGRLAGAALDTFAWEPLRADDPLLELARDPGNNLLLTPHVAAGTKAAEGKERAGDYDNLLAVLHGGELKYRVV